MRTKTSLLFLGLVLSACDKAPNPDSVPSEPPASARAATPATSAAPTPTASAAAAPVATPASAPPKAAASPEPELKEWDSVKADLTLVRNWAGPGCMARRVREWVRVGCSASSTEKGAPIKIQVTKGFPKAKYSVLDERGGSIMLVFPATEGLDAEATFSFTGGAFRFAASWPAGQPEPKTIGAFQEIEEPAAGVVEEFAEPSDVANPSPPKSGKAVVSDDALPELPVVEGAPTAEQWEAAKEVGVKGSDGVGCETKQIGEWFRVVCRSNNITGKVTATTPVRGVDPKVGYLVTGNGALVLLTKYVKGTDLAIDITWERANGQLTLKWPENLAGPPALRGELTTRTN